MERRLLLEQLIRNIVKENIKKGTVFMFIERSIKYDTTAPIEKLMTEKGFSNFVLTLSRILGVTIWRTLYISYTKALEENEIHLGLNLKMYEVLDIIDKKLKTENLNTIDKNTQQVESLKDNRGRLIYTGYDYSKLDAGTTLDCCGDSNASIIKIEKGATKMDDIMIVKYWTLGNIVGGSYTGDGYRTERIQMNGYRLVDDTLPIKSVIRPVFRE